MALILREKHVRSLLNIRDTVDVLDEAFNALAQGAVLNHPRSRLALTSGVLNILAAAVPTFGVVGHKTYTAFRDGVRFVVMLYDAYDGHLLALIEADWLGSMRTGGTSALATKYMARADAAVVGMIGAGNQAVTQLMGMCAVRPITTVYVYSRSAHECEIFCSEMSRLLNRPVHPVSTARQAVEVAEIVITATTAREPVLFGEWLRPGCHINAIGSNWAQRREIDTATLLRADLIVTDSLEQAQMEAGDFIIPANEGLIDWERIYEIADIIGNDALLRASPNDITLYKGLGIALEDIAIAAHVYKLAAKQGIGEELNLLS